MDTGDPRLISYSVLAVVVVGGAWAIRAMVRRFADQQQKVASGPTPLEKAIADGQIDTAIRLAMDTNQWEVAADLQLRQGKRAEAARSLRSAHQWDRAGLLFEELHDYGAAVQAFRRASNKKALMRNLIAAQDWAGAADHAEQESDLLSAADFAKRAGQGERAVALLRRAGKVRDAAQLQGVLLEDGQQWIQAAEHWQGLSEWARAAQAFDQAGDGLACAAMLARDGRLELAADRFVQHAAHAEAASLYEQLGAYRKAALHYQKAGDVEHAINALALEGDKATVVKMRMALGHQDEALRVALSATPGDAAFVELTKMAIRLQVERDDKSGAARSLVTLLQAPLSSEERHQYGVQCLDTLVSLGDLGRARQAWERLRQVEPPGTALATYLAGMESKLLVQHTTALGSGFAAHTQAQILSIQDEFSAHGPRLPAATDRGLVQEATQSAPDETITIPGDGADGAWPTGVPAALATRYGGLSRLGQGGNGVVFRATDKLLGRIVVLKFMLEGSMPTDMARKYFLREVKLAANLNHPNIVHIYDMGESEGTPWYAMEFVDGRALTTFLPIGTPVSDPAWMLQVLEQLCAALDHAHNAGLIHRDIKPDNVLVASDGSVKLLDFGLARGRGEGFGELSVLAGTPYYMAPEQLDGSTVDHRADIYALGVILFRMLTGQLPFTEGNVFVAHAVAPVPDLLKINPLVPEAAAQVVHCAMAKRPSERYGACRPLFEAVRAALQR